MGKTKKKDTKKTEKPKSQIGNKLRMLNSGRQLVGHVNGKPLYSVNGKRPMVVTDEARSRHQVGKIGAGKIVGVVKNAWQCKNNGKVDPRIK